MPILSMKTPNERTVSTGTSADNDTVLVVFIHGFRSMASTFGQFPKFLEDILLSELGIRAITVSYPTYKTKGEMDKIVSRFSQWLTDLVSEHEEKSGLRHTKIVLCAHSLGGLLAADLLRRQAADASLGSKIIACIAFDTPYLGMNGSLFKNIASSSTCGSMSTSSSTQADISSNIKWARVGIYTLGCSALAGAAGFAIVIESLTGISVAALGGVACLASCRVRDDLSRGLKWTTDYWKYLKDNLFNKDLMEKRLEDLVNIEKSGRAIFRVLYTSLPRDTSPRTFVALPKVASQAAEHFLPAVNKLASNEIMAHIGMFCGRTNDGYDELGRWTANLITEALMKSM